MLMVEIVPHFSCCLCALDDRVKSECVWFGSVVAAVTTRSGSRSTPPPPGPVALEDLCSLSHRPCRRSFSANRRKRYGASLTNSTGSNVTTMMPLFVIATWGFPRGRCANISIVSWNDDVPGLYDTPDS